MDRRKKEKKREWKRWNKKRKNLDEYEKNVDNEKDEGISDVNWIPFSGSRLRFGRI